MRHFSYISGEFYAENVPLSEIADKVGTPTYIYSNATLCHHYNVLKNALSGLDVKIAFAIKANSNRAIIATLAALGAGADTVSKGEIMRALNAGVKPNRIVFSGVGKAPDELKFAAETGIRQINIESKQELETLANIANSLGKVQDIVIRVNPDVAAGGHDKISTGKKTSKFGVGRESAIELFKKAATLENINACGFAVHIGSQIVDISPLRAAYQFVADMVKELRAEGYKVSRLDLGGGLAAIYDDADVGPDLDAYGEMVREIIGPLGVEIDIEPGRLIAANAGILLSRALVTKENGGRDFVIIDAAMNDLARPAMYDAFHQILPIKEPQAGANMMPTTIVGPVCETGDTFTIDREMPPIAPNELVAIMSAGAYGFSMASNYNSRPLVAEIMVNGDEWEIVRPRQSYEEIMRSETLPKWL